MQNELRPEWEEKGSFFFWVKIWNGKSRNRCLSVVIEKKAFANWMWSKKSEKLGDNLGKKIMKFVLDELIKIGMISVFAWIHLLITYFPDN